MMRLRILRRRLAFVVLLLGLVLEGCSPAAENTPVATSTGSPSAPPTPAPTSAPIRIGTLQDLQAVLREIATASPEDAQARAEDLWNYLASAGRVPLILGEQVVFFYRGEAEQVNWRGAFNSWGEPGLRGIRLGSTDLWSALIEVPPASRLEYKIVLNGDEWIVDPANPDTEVSGLTGENSVLTLPGFTVTDESLPQAGAAAGSLTPDLTLDSRALGYEVNYRVYTPSGYAGLDHLPVLYVLDGNDFVDERMGALASILDNLITDGRIRPLLAVFIDSREPGDPQHNRREDEFLVRPEEHARFVADELVPAIDGAYRTDPRPEARGIVGVSYGGLSAIYIACVRSDVFHDLAALSPSMWVLEAPQYLPDPLQIAGSQEMVAPVNAAAECGEGTGFPCPRLPLRVFLSAGVPAWDVGEFDPLVEVLEEQGYPVEFRSVSEGHTWSHWRGVSDEMLVFFFGAN